MFVDALLLDTIMLALFLPATVLKIPAAIVAIIRKVVTITAPLFVVQMIFASRRQQSVPAFPVCHSAMRLVGAHAIWRA